MSREPDRSRLRPSRRGLVRAAAGLAAAAGSGFGVARHRPSGRRGETGGGGKPDAAGAVEQFWGAHQGGITTPAQAHSYFAAFDLEDDQTRRAVIKMLRDWTAAAARMAAGQPRRRSGQECELPGSRYAARRWTCQPRG